MLKKELEEKIKNLSGKKVKTPELNFAGISNELICDGGEYKFIQNMIRESEKLNISEYTVQPNPENSVHTESGVYCTYQ